MTNYGQKFNNGLSNLARHQLIKTKVGRNLKGNRYQHNHRLLQLATLGVLLIMVLVACNDDKKSDEPEATSVSGIVAPNATVVIPATIPPPVVTVVVTRTPAPSETPTATPTLNFPAYRVAGTWQMFVRFDINNGALVDKLGYSGSATVDVSDNGTVMGAGTLYPDPSDAACNIRPLNAPIYEFTIRGTLRPDNERILMDIELVPTAYDAPESYYVFCPEDLNGPREVTQPNLIWPVLTQSERLKFTFDLDQPSYTVTFTEDIAALTGGVVQGLLAGELIVQP
jgi:hypothetical protein